MLGVNGWVKNTRTGTVVGQVQGPPEKVKEMYVCIFFSQFVRECLFVNKTSEVMHHEIEVCAKLLIANPSNQ